MNKKKIVFFLVLLIPISIYAKSEKSYLKTFFGNSSYLVMDLPAPDGGINRLAYLAADVPNHNEIGNNGTKNIACKKAVIYTVIGKNIQPIVLFEENLVQTKKSKLIKSSFKDFFGWNINYFKDTFSISVLRNDGKNISDEVFFEWDSKLNDYVQYVINPADL